MTPIRRFAGQHRGLLRAAVSVTVSAVLLYLVLRAVPLGGLLDALSEVPPVLPLLAATLSSWGASLILPGPSGDAVFAWLARTRLGKPVAVGLGAALLSRL